jgi:hypothetical protein
MEMVPHYKARHKRQEVGVEGLDLTEWRHQEILISARAISCDSIQQFDNAQFHVTSRSCPWNYHAVDVTVKTMSPRLRATLKCKADALEMRYP